MKRQKSTSHYILHITGLLLPSSLLFLFKRKTENQFSSPAQSYLPMPLKPLYQQLLSLWVLGEGEENCKGLLSTNNCQCFLL